MTKKERVAQAIFRAVDDVNQLLPHDQQVEKSLHTALLDESGKLDSLGIINLIVTSEQKIEEEFGTAVALIDGTDLAENPDPLKTVGNFVDYVTLLLEK